MKDPVRHCDLYKDEGCSHVDGYLCEFDSCDMRYQHGIRKGAEAMAREIDREVLESLKRHDWSAAIKKLNKPK